MKKLHSISFVVLASLQASTTLPASAQSTQLAQPSQTAVQVAALAQSGATNSMSTNNSAGWHSREGAFFKRNWGVDIVDVRRVASGQMLAFRYVVLDPEKAKPLNDKRNTAYLFDEKTGAKLMVPQMEKVGALRTTVSQKTGRMYWMVFANTGRVVSVGSRVDLVIGDFRANGLTVD